MRTYYQFDSSKEMLETLQNGIDLYCKELGSYAFAYNDSGSICFYNGISEELAKELKNKQFESGEYWGAFLGAGGEIYDDPSYEDFNPNLTSNIQICEAVYGHIWEDVTPKH